MLFVHAAMNINDGTAIGQIIMSTGFQLPRHTKTLVLSNTCRRVRSFLFLVRFHCHCVADAGHLFNSDVF